MPAGFLRAASGRPAAVSARILAMFAFNGADFFIPLAAKRFHDTGRRVWWLLALLVPIVGLIWTVQELAFRQGEPQTNSFGTVPRLKMAQRK